MAIAAVERRGEQALPLLSHCEFVPSTSDSGVAQILQQLAVRHRLNKTPCVSIASSDDFALLLVEAPEVKPAELKAALRWRVKDLLDFHIDDAILDVFDIPGQQERGRTRQMYVVAAKTSTVQAHIDLLEGQGIQLEVIDIPELALRNIATLLPENDNGVAMLHIGPNSGLLTISRGGVLYLTRAIKLGYRQMEKYLQAPVSEHEPNEDEFTLDEAEGETIPEILIRALDSVVLEVQRSLDYCESHFSLPPVSGLVLAPMEIEIPPLMSYLASNLGVPVRVLDLNAIVDSATHLDDTLQSRCLLAIGAALRHESRAL